MAGARPPVDANSHTDGSAAVHFRRRLLVIAVVLIELAEVGGDAEVQCHRRGEEALDSSANAIRHAAQAHVVLVLGHDVSHVGADRATADAGAQVRYRRWSA